MASTYSYPIETDVDFTLLEDVLQLLQDNTAQLIAPRDVRDAVYYLWQNIIFKPTTIGTTTQYIGIDDTSIKDKILIGKKERQDGVFVMNNNLLNSDGDIFFYNTKTGSSNYDTKLVFLAGTSSNYSYGQIFAPYLTSKVTTDPYWGNYLDLQLVNPTFVTDLVTGTQYGGNINIESDYGYVNINNLNLPTKIQNQASTDGYVLTFRQSGGNYYARWEAPTASTTTPLVYFSDPNEVPQTIGGINAGETFSNVLIQDMMRRLIYPYIPPTLTLTTTNYVEGTDAYVSLSTSLNYSINVSSTYSVTTFSAVAGTSLTSALLTPPFTKGTTSSSGTASFSTNINSGNTFETKTFSLYVQDTKGTYVTSSTTLKVVLPWFYGTSNVGTTSSTGINSILGTTSNYVPNKLTLLLTDPALSSSSVYNKSLALTGNQKYVYFGYPAQFPDLVQILDNNSLEVTGSFVTFSVSITSALSKWNTRPYKFYVYVGPSGVTPSITTIGSPFNGYTENYQFLFATAS